ncbi:hypothetical protein [Streptomyces camelliae]|uniref:Uncharacterized protein n=1 Tax=Streptomyces camelliae TaxID=3004093 RepID=A0ABY7P7C9_9ACTN|nr:hypothetical protein [Streptomyces sp. HUAS 2-6]WBO64751.1 hypothetical protein O1G22_18860 [Streptomyces sp. HUAS 2-6]
MLGAVPAVGAAVPMGVARPAWAASTAPGPEQLTLRELMASVWYPAHKAEDLPRAPWMTEGALRAFLADVGFPLDPAREPCPGWPEWPP